MSKRLKIILLILLVIIIGIAVVFKDSILPSVQDIAKDKYVLVYRNATLVSLADSLVKDGFIKSKSGLLMAARLMQFKDKHLREGRFKAKPGWNDIRLLHELAHGPSAPVKFVMNPVRKVENLAAVAGNYLEYDSLDFLKAILDPAFLAKSNIDSANAMTLFIPNTYEIYWQIKPDKFVEKMHDEEEKFWNEDDRPAKLKALGMTKEQVYTLASIVDKETQKKVEKARIAGLYLNRLHNNMRLQADPTVVFGYGDFTIKRILTKHIEYDTPYNTYLHDGLPPGPIGMASIAGIDAVLNHEVHNYLYMVARPDYSGLHDFSETFESHREKANKYRDWLTTQNIVN
jgi:UPF0755 protein